jgi:putative hemolysin
MDSVSFEIILVAIGILANGFFAGSEIALVSSRISRLAELRQRAVRGASAALRLKEKPEAFLATIQIAITAVGTLASALGGATAVEALTPWLGQLGLSTWARPAALGIVIVAITYVSLVVGELTPKAIALRNPERLACLVGPVIERLARASAALVGVLTVSTNGLLRLLGQGRTQQSPFVSEEEVRYLVREGAAKGIFEKVEEELVHNVFEFADATVREVLTPRHVIESLDVATSGDDLLRAIARIGHSRIPVYRASPESIVGVLVLKDVVNAIAAGEPLVASTLARPPLFVPETARLSAVLRQFQRSRQQMAIVVNEYGGLEGLVTVEDIVEEIVGDIEEEGAGAASTGITRLPDGSAIVDGTARLDDLRRELGIPIDDSDVYTTAAGLVIAALDAIPTSGVSVVRDGHRWTVLEVDGPRVTKLRVQAERDQPPA